MGGLSRAFAAMMATLPPMPAFPDHTRMFNPGGVGAGSAGSKKGTKPFGLPERHLPRAAVRHELTARALRRYLAGTTQLPHTMGWRCDISASQNIYNGPGRRVRRAIRLSTVPMPRQPKRVKR